MTLRGKIVKQFHVDLSRVPALKSSVVKENLIPSSPGLFGIVMTKVCQLKHHWHQTWSSRALGSGYALERILR